MDFDISFTICLKCQSLFSRKKNLINLLSDEFAQRVWKRLKPCSKYYCSGHSYYTPYIQSMWGYIVFAFPFVHSFVRMYIRSFVRTFVRSFVFPSQGQSFCVKVYKTSYFEDPLMDFVHIWHDGRYRSKVFISTIPTPGVTLGSRSRT